MIYTEDQIVKVNGVVLPGLVKSIEVKESAQIDEQEVEGSATKPKQATGYEDAKVNIELILDDLSLIHISEPTRQAEISYAVFCLKKKNKQEKKKKYNLIQLL